MLQISTGKFFDEPKRKRHNCKFVFYTNASVHEAINIESPDIKFERIERGAISCYLVEYVLITEEHPIIIRIGEEDFVSQFLLIFSFYFDCIARLHREDVHRLCGDRSSGRGRSASASLAPRIYALSKEISRQRVNGFQQFFGKLIGVERKRYRAVIDCLKLIDHSKEILSSNFDLAYSINVYGLESLAQKFDGYTPSWNDFHPDVKSKIDVVLHDIDAEAADEIRGALIQGKQFKLRKRFENFIDTNLVESFYSPEFDAPSLCLRKSHLQRSLNNLYELRSSYVHELKPMDSTISDAYQPNNDFIVRFGEPILTYSGLARVTSEVILNFIKNSPVAGEERLNNWMHETSGIVIAELAAEAWIGNADGFGKDSCKRWFQSFLGQLNDGKVTNQNPIMSKIESIYASANSDQKSVLINYYLIYNRLVSGGINNWEDFIKRNISDLADGNIYFLVSCIYLFLSTGYLDSSGEFKMVESDSFDDIFSKYQSSRFHKKGFSLPALTEAALLCGAANVCLYQGNIERYKDYLLRARHELTQGTAAHTLIRDAEDQGINVNISDLLSAKV